MSDSHLPECSFIWVPLQRPVLLARAQEKVPPELPVIVRRILFTPKQSREPEEGAAMTEPFVVSGSWWGTGKTDSPFLRHYYYRTSRERVLWMFLDKLTGTRWIQGAVD
jgi:hypothetical protein